VDSRYLYRITTGLTNVCEQWKCDVVYDV